MLRYVHRDSVRLGCTMMVIFARALGCSQLCSTRDSSYANPVQLCLGAME
jgi:hypothetical protein